MSEIMKAFKDKLQPLEYDSASSDEYYEECLIKSLSMVLLPVEENKDFFDFNKMSVIYEDYSTNSIGTMCRVDILQ